MWNKYEQMFLGCESGYNEAEIVLFGAPFDSTVSYHPGARFGPAEMRAQSFGIETYSPYEDRDLEDEKVFDGGDLALCIGDAPKALLTIKERVDMILADGKIPCMLGGEHLVTLGAVQAVAEKHPDLAIIHFDAHADLREDYLGAKLSHACVMRRCFEVLGAGRIYQFGIRSGDKDEFAFSREGHVAMRRFDFAGLEEVVKSLNGTPVYFTIDLDVLDPSAFPGTGTPEAGGVTFLELLRAMQVVCEGANVVGCDVVELCPPYDQSGVSTLTACKVLRELLLGITKK